MKKLLEKGMVLWYSKSVMSNTERQVDFKDVKDALKDLIKSQKETDRQFKETDRRLKESKLDVDRQLKETDRRLRQLDDLFNGQWGKLIESLVKGDIVNLLQKRGIEVTELTPYREKTWKGQKYEFDIIAINGEEVVVVEVKTTLRLKDLREFTDKLKKFKKIFEIYKDKKVYGGVAYIKANEGTSRKAEKDGLFVIRATGDSASIINEENFCPKAF